MNRIAAAAALSLLAVTAAGHAQASSVAPAPPQAAPAPQAAPEAAAAPKAAPKARAGAGQVGAASPAGRLLDRLLEGIELRPEQTAAIAELRAEFEKTTAALRADLRARVAELRRLRGAESAGTPLLKTKREELQAQQEKLRAEADQLAAKISELLDPAQRTAFESAREQMRRNPPAGRLPAPSAAPAESAGTAAPTSQV